MKAKVLKPILPYSFEIGKVIDDAEALFGVAQTKDLIEQGYIMKMPTDITDVSGLDSALSERPVNTRVSQMIATKLPTKVSDLTNDKGFITHGQEQPSTVPGPSGQPGQPGSDGKSVELRKSLTAIQWRQVGATWADLVALTEITGPAGNPGQPGQAGVSPMATTSNVSMPLIALGGIYSFNVTVPGATTSMCAVINFPSGLLDSLASYSVNIEAANTVTVRLKAGVALTAGTRTFQIRVIP